MREHDHVDLMYVGAAGELVTVRVKEQGTTHMVTYKLDAAPAKALKKGTPLTFNLKNGAGERTNLQMTFEFNGQGSYEVTVANVTNCSNDGQGNNECVNTWDGPPLAIGHFSFFVG